jgi:site-specific DNA-methyltransferase (adenine-specific)
VAGWHAYHGDCLTVMASMPENTFDAVVCDPPYELNFMGRSWDRSGVAFQASTWAQVLRVLKPGGHLLAFGGTRTYHRMVCAIEDAGFEIRDMIGWLYGSGFPKSLDVSKAIDKAAGAERKVIGTKLGMPGYSLKANDTGDHDRIVYGQFTDAESECAITAPATPEAAQWQGWGTALKPAQEPICVARKPLSEETVAANVLRWGTGALNIDASRVPVDPEADASQLRIMQRGQRAEDTSGQTWGLSKGGGDVPQVLRPEGRWPANAIHDGSGEVLEAFAAAGERTSGKPGVMRKGTNDGACYGAESRPPGTPMTGFGDSGSAARFFYCAKANKADRAGSKHPTIKPVALMRHLVTLVTPPGGLVLDPFAGSGTTLQAAVESGFNVIGIEQEAEYHSDILNRMKDVT